VCALGSVVREEGGIRNLVVVTVSEGIGTGIFANGQLVRGLHGAAESLVTFRWTRRGRLAPAADAAAGGVRVEPGGVAVLQGSHRNSGSPSFQDVLDLAERGDRLAGKALDTMAHYLGRGMRMVVPESRRKRS